MRELYLVLVDIRSAHNVGSIFRTADGLGVRKLLVVGHTPYPEQEMDPRLPHVRKNTTAKITKTALGAEGTVPFHYFETFNDAGDWLTQQEIEVWAVEQRKGSINLRDFVPPQKVALVLGNEVEGLDQKVLEHCKGAIEIPMQGKKESLNVSIAAAIAAYMIQNA